MKNIINEIIKGKSLVCSKELFIWVQQSDENQKEYIRYKNLWAMLQIGKKMDSKYIAKDYKLVKRQIHRIPQKIRFLNLVKYAAIIIISITCGNFINTLNTLQKKIAVNEISVPNGNRSLIVLPDGSNVWLTNGSKIIYPESFTGNTRNVKLEGEAYFKVSHNEERPFIVNLGEQRVKVLGTEFSIIAYPDDNIVQVDLVSGKVQLDINEEGGFEKYKSYVLRPLHSIVLDKTSENLKNLEIPDSFYKYWQEGIYKFKEETFENLAKRIERIYGMEIIFESQNIREQKFTGAFFIDSNIYTIIETFKRASKTPFEYTIDKNQIYLKPKK
jgi:transmembrane sensor